VNSHKSILPKKKADEPPFLIYELLIEL
jgi:hypothetical protein